MWILQLITDPTAQLTASVLSVSVYGQCLRWGKKEAWLLQGLLKYWLLLLCSLLGWCWTSALSSVSESRIEMPTIWETKNNIQQNLGCFSNPTCDKRKYILTGSKIIIQVPFQDYLNLISKQNSKVIYFRLQDSISPQFKMATSLLFTKLYPSLWICPKVTTIFTKSSQTISTSVISAELGQQFAPETHATLCIHTSMSICFKSPPFAWQILNQDLKPNRNSISSDLWVLPPKQITFVFTVLDSTMHYSYLALCLMPPY